MPNRRTGQLHGHRWSAPGVRYFVTACTLERRRGLEERATTDQIIECTRKSDALGDTTTIALCVMPDHVHWLFELGGRLTLGRVIARLKMDTRKNLTVAGLAWQRDFFEQRLRAEESAEDYARYVFLNPYRADLVAVGSLWRGWWCPRLESFRFSEHLNADGSPPTEWVGLDVPKNLIVGE